MRPQLFNAPCTPPTRRSLRIILAALTLALAACGNAPPASPEPPPPSPEPATPTLTPTPTPTPTVTATPTVTVIGTPTPIPAVEDDYLFAGAAHPDCQLPCWFGLRVGEASEEDVLPVLDDVFSFATAPRAPRTTGFTLYSIPPDGLQVSGYRWDIPEGHFDAVSILDAGTGKTHAFIFDHSAPPDNTEFAFYTPQDFLRSLGEPTAIHAEFLELAPNAPYAGLARIYIVYDVGVATLMVMHYQTISTETFEFCLGQESTNQIIYLFEPYTDPATVNDLQNNILRRTGLYPPFEDIFGLSPADVTHLAVTQDNACLRFQ